MNGAEPDLSTWELLQDCAKQIVDHLIARLPDDLRPEALRIGYKLHRRCPDEHLWGSYCSSTQTIKLYIEAIRDDCVEESSDLHKEIETTYLHELGHHLGLGEAEVEAYGL